MRLTQEDPSVPSSIHSCFSRANRTDFHPFYFQNSLLILFILDACLEIDGLMQSIQKDASIEALALEAEKKSMPSTFSVLLHRLSKKSLGFDAGLKEAVFIQQTLTKLVSLAEQLSMNAEQKNAAFSELHYLFHKSWLLALEFASSLTASQKSANPLLNLEALFRQALPLLEQILEEFVEDENILLYLLQKQEALSRLFGENLLTRPLFKGRAVEELIEQLKKAYHARGFDDMSFSALARKEHRLAHAPLNPYCSI